MKIAQLTYSYRPIIGGADAYADLLCSTLRGRDHEVWVYQRAAETDDPFVRAAPGWQARLRPRDFWLVPYWLRLRRGELRAMDALIAHYPNYCRAGYFHPRLIGLSHGVTWDDEPGAWRSQQKRALAREAYRRCSRFVANDTFFLREVGVDIAPGEGAFQEVEPGRWFIPNCVDTVRFSPPDAPDQRAPLITVPRNLYRNRGVHLAVEAFTRIAAEWPEWTMEIVGADGQADYAAEVRALVRRLGLSDRVWFAGGVPWHAMAPVYGRARVCLIPSLCGEGTSLAALEAMACATATVVTTAGGLPDLPAIHCDPSADALTQALRKVLPGWREAGQTQRAAVTAGFALEHWQAAWARVVEEW
ncbi:MAG: glycosyltransferase family 4 protein [Armatimonadetes bacterium]|nr:glycosyltransferase family 4 protein [Armatimonadota bacterium]